MALPTQDQNLVGTHVKPVADLGLLTTVPAGSTETGTVFSTGVPCTVLVVSKLTSGACTLKIKVAATAAAAAIFSSPTATLSCTGTAYQMTLVETASSTLYVGVQQVDGGSGTVFDKLAVLPIAELTQGEDWYSIRHGSFNAVAGLTQTTNSDGSGVVNLASA